MGEYTEKIKKPYFSVILPIYNVEAYLKDCVESVLAQNFSDYEIILVDDGATDGCPAICDEYAEKYPGIKVIHKENGGLSSARNAGLDMAQGEYVWWVDSDDWIEKGALRKLWNAGRDERADMIKFGYSRSGQKKENQSISIEPGKYCRREELEQLVDSAFHNTRFCLSAWSHVYRREFIESNSLRFVSERLVGSEDYLFNLQALPLAGSVIVSEDILYCYRLRSGSLSQNYRQGLDEKYTMLFELLKEHYKKTGTYSQYMEKLSCFYVWHLIYGTCISREYRPDRQNKDIGRSTVKKILDLPQLQAALVNGAGAGLNWKRRIHYLAMRMKFEPFFYWLFVIKTKKGTKQA